MKKVISMALILICCVSVLAACSGSSEMSANIPDAATLESNLKEKGYVVSSLSKMTYSLTLALYGADDKNVEKALEFKKDGEAGTVYYFKTADDAKLLVEGWKAFQKSAGKYAGKDVIAADDTAVYIGSQKAIKDIK